jgi:hypothetical protein
MMWHTYGSHPVTTKRVTVIRLAAEEAAAQRAAAKKEPSKRQKHKQKRKVNQERNQNQNEETPVVVPYLAMPSRAEQEAMLAESSALSAHYAALDRQAALPSISRAVDSEVEYVDDEDGAAGAGSEIEIVDPAEVVAEGEPTTPVAATAAAAEPELRHLKDSPTANEDSSSDERPALVSPSSSAATTTAILSSDDEAWRQAVQVAVLLDGDGMRISSPLTN